jgi:hypothetical protein
MPTTYELKYSLYDSIEAMLSPETLNQILKCTVSRVTCQPFETTNGFSGNQMFHVQADEHRLVMKRLRPSVDWLAYVSNDRQCRSIRVWQYGLLDRLQPHIKHGILAACREGEDYAILMQDVSDGLTKWGQEIAPAMVHRMLDGLAAMHAIFWEDENLKDAELGLSSVDTIITAMFSTKLEQYQHAPHIFDMIKQGELALYQMVDPDVREALQSISKNPQLLSKALSELPSTFVHSDFRLDNLALLPDTKELFVFDWQTAGYAPATICMCWFVMSGGIFHHQEAYFEYYRQRLSERLGHHFDQRLWKPMLELGCLVNVLRQGSFHAFFATTHEDPSFRAEIQRSVDTYNDIVRRGLAWL